jgi:putative hydrolase of the HAD superfamily
MIPGELRASSVDARLVEGVDVLCLDAGNTLIFLDHERLAVVCAEQGFATTAGDLARAEGVAKRAHEGGVLVDGGWAYPVASARAWGLYVGTLLAAAGLAPERLRPLLDAVWSDHRRANLWSKTPAGIADALDRARAAGLRVAIVSNSEGQLESVLDRAGLAHAADVVIDSGVVGVEKPDPRIFRIALDRLGVKPDRALHLGDVYALDVVGARSAGLRAALVDPAGHFDGLYPDVPRVAGVREVALELAGARGLPSPTG